MVRQLYLPVNRGYLYRQLLLGSEKQGHRQVIVSLSNKTQSVLKSEQQKSSVSDRTCFVRAYDVITAGAVDAKSQILLLMLSLVSAINLH